MDLGIGGRKALVRGASQGLGYACALALAEKGADVTLVSRRRALAEEFAAACAFLCGTRASCITGQNLLVDGGLCALTV